MKDSIILRDELDTALKVSASKSEEQNQTTLLYIIAETLVEVLAELEADRKD